VRAFNRLLCALLALAIAGAGGLTAAEVFIARVHWSWLPDPPLVVPYDTWLREFRAHEWSQRVVMIGSIAGIVGGLILILLGIFAIERRVQMTASRSEIDLSTSRRSLARFLDHDAQTVDGVAGAKVKVGRRTAKVRAAVRLGDPQEVRETLRGRLQDRLDDLPLVRRPTLSVRISDARRYR
jgi:Family of unknown function (DUF6286)